ncbi:MAG: O-methyltransferase [Chloroflexota bacterium]|nr:O-methyltransferase [Chloroflexota bacterium]
MSESTWTEVDNYFTDLLVPADPILDATQAASVRAGLPQISVSANLGKLLYLLARLQGARSILEVGTLGGYSTIWLARALPDGGRMITLEFEPKHAKVARENIERAGLSDIVEVRLGAALETMKTLVEERKGPFDLVFIDADKVNYPGYFTWALKLCRRGSLIIADNIVRNGAVVDPENSDPNVQGVRAFNDLVAAEPRVSATAIQTVGIKGYDGFAFALVTSEI